MTSHPFELKPLSPKSHSGKISLTVTHSYADKSLSNKVPGNSHFSVLLLDTSVPGSQNAVLLSREPHVFRQAALCPDTWTSQDCVSSAAQSTSETELMKPEHQTGPSHVLDLISVLSWTGPKVKDLLGHHIFCLTSLTE